MTVLVFNSEGSTVKNSVTDAELGAIVRPWYLSNLTGSDIIPDTTYEVSINNDFRNSSICGFVLGVGTNCTNHDTKSSSNCYYSQFGGQKGTSPTTYINANKLVTFKGAINEWKLYGQGSPYHPLHIHVNHFQVVSYSGFASAYYRVGQWRDTLPPVANEVTLRFVAADYTGETILHCHFQRHEDLGMMDSYLITDASTYASIFTSAPTPNPTIKPSKSPTASPTKDDVIEMRGEQVYLIHFYKSYGETDYNTFHLYRL
jgi:hypothetical protein